MLSCAVCSQEMEHMTYREAVAAYIRENASPPDKFIHQPRVYDLARSLGRGMAFDDDVLYAAAWLHDLGVFLNHRPIAPEALSTWDHVAYAVRQTPGLLTRFGFPCSKISAVVEAIRTHLPSSEPSSVEGTLLRDADLLELLGATGIMRACSKVGRDTRYGTHRDAVRFLARVAREVPGKLRLPQARELARHRLALMNAFLLEYAREGGEALDEEACLES